MLVEEVMSTDLVTCDIEASVRDAAERMLRNRVGSVVVTNGETPAGIATEADVLHAACVTDAPFSAIPLRKAMSGPLATVQPTKTLRTATDRMRSEGVKKLVVVEGMTPVGIVTTVDIVDNYAGIRREVRDLATDAERWSSRENRLDG
ncbi:CBS domain-containing protein [Halorubrum saccharovorum DSM 1137]|uniref:CBS domain-containing protein n=1 Tax=Halorubrum saccharovorum DSM 1137 TaxID=1227484 RepID=M0E682_9EURY|nr:CBS domain-containing protein [Halorubrum saccharovorum]ELZ42432.1 CBS domain-containing protein [Halorubrum saccharovorum DSM 1137]